MADIHVHVVVIYFSTLKYDHVHSVLLYISDAPSTLCCSAGKAADVPSVSPEDLEEIEQILESLVEERTRLKKEQETLKELKQDVTEYLEV